MRSARRKYKKILLFAALLAFFFIGFLGFGHADMTLGSDGQMTSNCPFMSEMSSLCQMNPLEHFAAWQSMFTAMLNKSGILTNLFLLLILTLGAMLIRANVSAAPPKIAEDQSLFSYYKRRIPIAGSLQEAFSNGILHPKLF